MAIFIDLWTYLFLNKLFQIKLFKWGHAIQCVLCTNWWSHMGKLVVTSAVQWLPKNTTIFDLLLEKSGLVTQFFQPDLEQYHFIDK